MNSPTKELTFAIDIALQAGALLNRYFNETLIIKQKSSERDLVTQADIASEKLIVTAIREAFPSHAILAEEQGQIGASEYIWLVDPLDGTTNFTHRYPVFSVVLALYHQGKILLAVTYDPIRNELFTAEKGRGSWLNDAPISVANNVTLQAAIVATGFPYDRATNPKNNMAEFCRVMPRVQGIRRGGSAALDMAYVACGRLDGYWEFHLNAWDFAGGVLLVEEAGGVVTNCDGTPWHLESRSVIAGNALIHNALAAMIK